jgi:hypothetical protein
MENQIPLKITGLKYNKETNKLERSFDPVSQEELDNISNYRLSFCQSCKEFTNQGKCKLCGCMMKPKSSFIWPLDENGKAFNFILEDGLNYVCRLKKW